MERVDREAGISDSAERRKQAKTDEKKRRESEQKVEARRKRVKGSDCDERNHRAKSKKKRGARRLNEEGGRWRGVGREGTR